MKFFVVLFAVVAVVAADVSHLSNEAAAQIESQDADVFPDQYQYSFKTSNGISGQESGSLKNVGREDEALEVQGANSYHAPGGEAISISYIANEFGYQPQGAHLPTPHPIPEYIARAIEYIRTHPPQQDRL